MQPGSTTYSFKGSSGRVIENGILKGATKQHLSEHHNFGDYALERLKANPEFVGQVDGVTERQETFAEMMDKSVKCATWLRKQNVEPGDVIGICTHNQMDMYVPCLASLYIGAVFNPWWDTGITKVMAKHFLTLTCPKVVFADVNSAQLIAEVLNEMDVSSKIVVFGNLTGHETLNHVIESQHDVIVGEFRCTKLSSYDDLALIAYTSGSTGMPKGAKHTHRSIYGNVENFLPSNDPNDDAEISLLFSPLAWTTGIMRMMTSIVKRRQRIIHPEYSVETIFQLIEKFKVSWFLTSPSPVAAITRSPLLSKYDLSPLKYLYMTGSVVKKETEASVARTFPHTNIRQAYGTTEFGGAVLTLNFDRHKFGSAGHVSDNIMMKVIDRDNGSILGPNETGEVCFKSPYTMIGYLKNPEATKEIIDDEGWLHTGDLGYYDEEGDVFFVTRIKEMIKYRGHHVSPSMIEEVIQSHPEVLEVAVLSVPNFTDDGHPIAFVATCPNARVTEEDIQKLVIDTLPDYMRLRGGVVFLKELPHTGPGKISRSDLKKMIVPK